MDLKAGTIIGTNFALEAEIGRGGMGSVWRARHVTLDRPVAIKFLDAPGPAAERRAERFLREAKIAAAIRHRHVVDIIDFGVAEMTPYIVMELLEGCSLEQRFTEPEPLDDRSFLDIMASVLAGLEAVHAAGIVHRDLKPANIFLLKEDDGVFFPKIVDFGISKATLAEHDSTGKITHTGSIIGTPHYMSPEQARGVTDLDLRSDLFSIGVILYEGLTGAPPFDAENLVDLLITIATQDTPPLELKRPDLPNDVCRVVERALARDRAKRFQTAREMREALLKAMAQIEAGSKRTADHAPSRSSRPPSPPRHVPARNETGLVLPVRKVGRGMLVGSAVGVLALAAIGAFFLVAESGATQASPTTTANTFPPSGTAPEGAQVGVPSAQTEQSAQTEASGEHGAGARTPAAEPPSALPAADPESVGANAGVSGTGVSGSAAASGRAGAAGAQGTATESAGASARAGAAGAQGTATESADASERAGARAATKRSGRRDPRTPERPAATVQGDLSLRQLDY
jgi:serine/threonine-protein kinase